MRLADKVGLEELVAEHVHVAAKVGANPGVKIGCLVAGMIAGCVLTSANWGLNRARRGDPNDS